MRGQMQKWGNSLAVRIPKAIADQVKLKEGDALEIEVANDGSLRVVPASKVPTLSQLVAQITPENRYEEVSLGPAVGKENVEW